eukprot:scaffold1681_cov237-Pinguiococcus_pyrenoidosus.AAC.2
MNHRKIKPVAELERARRIVNKRKREAKELLRWAVSPLPFASGLLRVMKSVTLFQLHRREVYMMNADLPRWDKFIDENGDVDVDEVRTTKPSFLGLCHGSCGRLTPVLHLAVGLLEMRQRR